MEQTLQALAGILLKAIPTIILVIVVHFYLKAMLFGPLSKVIAQRDTLTSGARGEANDSLARAEAKVAEYQKAIEQARADIGRDQEQQRKQWLEEQAARMNAARSETDQKIAQAKAEIAKEAATVRQQLIDTTAQLADEIANTILKGKRA